MGRTRPLTRISSSIELPHSYDKPLYGGACFRSVTCISNWRDRRENGPEVSANGEARLNRKMRICVLGELIEVCWKRCGRAGMLCLSMFLALIDAGESDDC